MTMITIAIVDDHPLFREGVSRSLGEAADFVVVGEGGSGEEAVSLAATDRPDVLLLDVSMPGGGTSVVSDILTQSPRTKVVMLTANEEVETLAAAMKRGAVGYILKGIGSRALAEAVRTVVRGSRVVSPAMSAKLINAAPEQKAPLIHSLTPRERQVMDLVAEGLSNKHIALRLDLQEKTVKHHMTQILTKLGVTNRTEAAIRWRDRP